MIFLVVLGCYRTFKGVSVDLWGCKAKANVLNIYLLLRDEITDEGDTWNLPEAGAFITFSPGFVKEPLWVSCSMWSPRSLSPPIGSNELLVSNLIELADEGPPTLESGEAATGCITMGLLHSASDFKGYEVVIKKLVDQENNEWEDLETRMVWNSAGI